MQSKITIYYSYIFTTIMASSYIHSDLMNLIWIIFSSVVEF